MTSAKAKKASPSSSGSYIFGIFLISIFLSAFLLFMVQPMAGKMLLPLVGGAPSGWIVALSFFQLSLLIGYVSAHWMGKLSARAHGLSLFILLAVGFYFLPLHFDQGLELKDSSKAAYNVFILLTTAIFVPFMALSSVSSTLQRLFNHTEHTKGQDPYFLYAVSNLGSFIGLLGYPIIIEPFLTVKTQTEYWMYGYGALVILILFCSLLTSSKTKKKEQNNDIENPSFETCIRWIALAFVPSSLMVGMTNFVTLEITPIPLFWVIPLALYLMTYILAFSNKFEKYSNIFSDLHPIAASFIVVMFSFSGLFMNFMSLSAHLVLFTIIAFVCHGELAKNRPDPKYLTAFYLYLAVGGALGGVLNAFIAPQIFTRLTEYPMVAVFSIVLGIGFLKKPPKVSLIIMLVGLVLCAAIGTYLMSVGADNFNKSYTSPLIYIVGLFGVVMVAHHPKYAFFFAAGLLFASTLLEIKADTAYTARNFFGTIKVKNSTITHEDKTYPIRTLRHGTTIHGIEILDDAFKNPAGFSYYAMVDEVLKSHPNTDDIALIGLGAGTLICYTAPDRNFVTFEIDDEIIKVAKEHFNFIKNCANDGNEIVLGDGRLEYTNHPKEQFDALIMDAFSSDIIPAHLLTKEAFAEYQAKLPKDGFITINISNRYFNLTSVIAKTAGSLGYTALFKHNMFDELPPWQYNSMWMVLSQSDKQVQDLKKIGWREVEPKKGTKIWTDDYTYVLSSLHDINEYKDDIEEARKRNAK